MISGKACAWGLFLQFHWRQVLLFEMSQPIVKRTEVDLILITALHPAKAK